nr:hypothetical protein [Escherichia coli]
MFSALRHRTAALALGVCFILPVHASSPKPGDFAKEGANKQVISSQVDSLIKISRIWADFFPANT